MSGPPATSTEPWPGTDRASMKQVAADSALIGRSETDPCNDLVMASDSEAALSTWGAGKHQSNATLRDGTVLKRAGAWSPSVIALLRHFEEVGFDGAPRVVGSGFAPDGRMALTYVPGTSAHPQAWPDGACTAIGALLRRAHDAAASFQVPVGAAWADLWLRTVGDKDDVIIGHGDAAPWNIVGPKAWPNALIDWDAAGPVPRLTEVAYAVWLNAQLHDDDIAEMHSLPDAKTRAGHARDIVDAYGLDKAQREALVDRMTEVALASARADAVDNNIRPDSADAVTASGYPLLWSITWRSRSAAWMLQQRRLLVDTISR